MFIAVLAMVASLFLPFAGDAARAAAGSLISGTVWADANRDGLRTADESVKGGVTVQLLSGPTGPIVGTTTSAANGTYSFANVADGAVYVRVIAPGAHRFPDTASGQNVFTRAEVPTTGNPERGITGPITIAGATQAPNRDAGLQPIATLEVDRLQIPNSCEGYATTGAPPWDATDGPGLDTGPGNCIVRVGDTVLQNYSVSLTGLPTGVSVPNVVIEMTIDPVSNPDDPSDVADSRLQLAGPGTNGLPAGCLAAANGANPPSSATTNADGSITVVCNLGPMSSNVGSVQLAYRFADDTPIPGFASVTASAYAGQDDAAPSNTVSGPVIEVTGTAEWEAKKSLQAAPGATTRTINGVVTPGFRVQYWIDLLNLRGAGGSDLQWPITFTDRMTKFPNAVMTFCLPRRLDNIGLSSGWTITCPIDEAAGADGWTMTASKPSNSPYDSTRILVEVFVPTEDAYRSVDPTWQHGDTPPTGTVSWENHVEDTDGWHMTGGQPNNPPGGVGPGFEAGWDGTTASGDNVVPRQFNITEPRWDLSKTNTGNVSFQERDLDNNPATPAVPGFQVVYQFSVNESNGNILSANIDQIAFKDVMPDWPGAVLTGCVGHSGNFNTGTPTCETGVQPADGWDMSFTPNANGNNTKTNTWQAIFFVPTPTVPDPCRANVNDTLSFRNEARETDGWTADDWPINDTGFEPGWDDTTATGNNVSTRTFNVRSTVSDCGTMQGNKQYEGIAGGLNDWNQFSLGDVVNSHVWTTATTSRISVTDPVVCDVFDVSVWRVSGNPLTPVTGADPNPHLQANPTNPNFDRNDYVIEYAVGSNTVDTQTGTGNGLDNTANVTDVRGCRDDDGPWTTDPAATFGADWRDEVNMVRARPVNAGHVEVGPFTLGLYVPLQSRWQYNGGPNAGEDIPQGVLLNNSGSWPETNQDGGIVYEDVSRQLAANLPITGYKYFTNEAGNAWADNTTVASGQRVQSWAGLEVDWSGIRNTGTARGVQAPGAPDAIGFPIDNPMVCDTFDVSVFQLDAPATFTAQGRATASEYVIEYGVGTNAVDTQAGAQVGGLYPVDRTSLIGDNTGCRDDAGPWHTDPAQFGADWRDQVNMVRIRPVEPDHVEHSAFRLDLRMFLRARGSYNGGPNDGEPLLTGIRLSNVGGWSTGPRGEDWATMQQEVRYQGLRLIVAKSAGQATYLPGQDAIWNLSVGVNDAAVGAVVEDLRLVDTVPAGLTYNEACTESRLPAGVTVSYNAATREVTFLLGDITTTAANYWIRTGATALQLCATLETVAQPGDTYVNQVQAMSDTAENAPTATATTMATGSGQLGLVKGVDKPFVASGEEYTWSLDWGNSSTVISFLPTDVIDVLPWNGDGANGIGSARDQFASSYQGLARLTGPLDPPTYVRKLTGDVPGTWYYATADPSTINHDPRNAANANPATAGGLWKTAAEITDFDDVTAVRFVSSTALDTGTRVRALIPMVSTSNDLDNLYVNRAQIYSATFPNQPLLSNEPYVQMPGFSVGDLVWFDRDGDGRYTDGVDDPVVDVVVELLDGNGDVVATERTDADGRWSVSAIPAGTYSARIPATEFRAGGPVEGYVPALTRNSDSNDENENVSNNNTDTRDPAETGLTSAPITLAYRYSTGADPRLIGANGPINDDVADLAPPLLAPEFTNFTIDLALADVPAVDIVKRTNTTDNNEPTGPFVAVGGTVNWTYTVTNTGTTDLVDVTVTDDMLDDDAAQIDCDGTGSNVVAGPLAPGAVFECTASGTATAGQYENLGSVIGRGPDTVDENGEPIPGPEVGDEDLDHYFGAEPAVDIEKHTNGVEADEPTGPSINAGDEVVWTYLVENTGNVDLTNVTVTDDQVDAADIDCGDGTNVVAGPLAPGETFECTATGTATAGQYENLGTVAALGPETTGPDGDPLPPEEVGDEDLDHYFGVDPAVDIEKHTNGQEADEPTGPLVEVGGPVVWTYLVENTGNVDLTDVTVTDDQVDAGDIDCGDGTNVVAGPLAPGETFECTATGTATAGQYENTGTVAALGPETTGPDGDPLPPKQVGDEDLDHYFGAEPAVDIEKHTNGQEADEPTGPAITVGDQVVWTYLVENTGNVDLTDVTVTDDMLDDDAAQIDCDGTGGNVIAGPLAPGETFECTATGTATAGQYENTGTVAALGPETTGPDGDPLPPEEVGDEDLDHYFGVDPAVDIEKHTNGQEADEPTGPLVEVGGPVVWTYLVENTGNVDLTDVTVTDDQVDAGDIDCGDGTNVVAGPLAPGETFECTATGTATAGQYENTGTVAALGPETTGPDGDPLPPEEVGDEDLDHYFGAEPAVDIEKSTNTEDADEPTGPLVAVGGPVRWVYLVENTGNVDLIGITVTDDQVAASEIDCGDGTNVVAGPLAPGETFECTATGTATAGQYENLGTVAAVGPETIGPDGEPLPPKEVTDEDWSHYLGAEPAVDIEKSTNGVDADEPTGPYVPIGDAVTWTYVVTNTGNTPLTDVVVTDDQVAADQIDCAGTGSNAVPGPLAAGESVECTATGVATAGQYANLGSVTATPPPTTGVDGEEVPPGPPVTDEDWSHYFGAVDALDLTKEAVDPDQVSGEGDVITYEFTLTNEGNVTVTDAEIVDQMEGLSELTYDWPGEPGVLEPGQSVTARATYAVTSADVAAQEVANTAFAVASPPDGDDPVVAPAVTEYVDVPPAPPAGLAATGFEAGAPWAFGGALVIAGGILFVITRRRKDRNGTPAR
ncbi:SdrD B-like domain-containing protein [Agromyces sp. S2-1-8]|uniref:DUF7507 domain-containing protein n=1 Tax=Agromyces sp. S2-1-8 TaxID=2897180 RepID=UPI001E6082A2|nr:SdrD B-like domain-containing protein [Agromyces sp. S2-1-8]MCD5345527.1 DUF11 domain-containing protein [Agromyces sp. S2-1-8]